ncbi:hypothetical protein MMC22_001021 [Lobaria immixta]|nr:hypothetical protein [Lobaria immixta]
MPHRFSQGDPSIPTLSLTDEDGSSCPIYTPEESIVTPLISKQADSMLDTDHRELDGSIESPSPDRRPLFSNNLCTTSETSFDNFVANEDLSSNQINISINENVVNNDLPLHHDMDLDTDLLQNTETRFIEGGSYTCPLEEEPRNTTGSFYTRMYTTVNLHPSGVLELAPGMSIAVSPGGWEQYGLQNPDSSTLNSSWSPRHILDINEPWTPYSSIHDSSHEPSSAEPLFAPGYSPTREASHFSQYNPGVDHSQGANGIFGHQDREIPCVTLGSSPDNDAIGQPPSSNPVGPPLRGLCDPAQVSGASVSKVKKKGGRIGKLDPQVKARAKDKRGKKDTCWHCKILRIPCKGSGTCNACNAMRRSAWDWGCVVQYLPDLTGVFLPASLLDQHDQENLRKFARQHIRRWMENFMIVYVGWGHGDLIRCEVHEIEPEGDHLLLQNQYRPNPETAELDTVQVPSPPIGMMCMPIEDWRKKLDKYLNETLETKFEDFPERCFRGREIEVQKDLLHSLHRYYVSPDAKEKDFLRKCLKLVIVTQIMTHTLTLVDEKEVYRQLKNQPTKAYGFQTSSRWLNKELKFLFSTLHQTLWKAVLETLQLTLQSSNKRPAWTKAFVALLLLAMMTESMQVQIRCKEETDKRDGMRTQESKSANVEIKTMDEKWNLLRDLFHKKFGTLSNGRAFNPIHHDSDRKNVDEAFEKLAQEVKSITEKHGTFLERRKLLEPPATSRMPNASRLVADFLLSFKPKFGPAAAASTRG